MQLAKWLEQHPRVRRVIYPGLPSHPQHELARRQMTIEGEPAGGGIISVDLEGDLSGTRRMMESLSVFTLAESLGGVESLANHPAIMTHASVPSELRAELGITDTLVRLSVGIEDVADLQEDLENSLAAMG
jgi:cystathionine gamma-lyase